MSILWNQPKMVSLLQDFYTIVPIRIALFDTKQKNLYSYPNRHATFCELMNATKEGSNNCIKSNNDAFLNAKRNKEPYFYQCHAGLTEMLIPIGNLAEESIGYIMLGQFKLKDLNERKWEDIYHNVQSIPLDFTKLEIAYGELSVIGIEQLKASAHILQALANYIWLNNYVRNQSDPLSKRIEEYMLENLSLPLSLSSLASKFEIGKTSLCSTIKLDYNMTVTELLLKHRMDRAKQLLRESNLRVSEIAIMVGLPDYNYFSRVFKKEIGVSPTIFRRLCANEPLLAMAHKA